MGRCGLYTSDFDSQRRHGVKWNFSLGENFIEGKVTNRNHSFSHLLVNVPAMTTVTSRGLSGRCLSFEALSSKQVAVKHKVLLQSKCCNALLDVLTAHAFADLSKTFLSEGNSKD